MSESKEKQINLAGTISYVEKEGNKFTAKLTLANFREAEKLTKASAKLYPALPPLTARYNEEKKEYAINIKSNYDFPKINPDSTKFEDEIRSGAQVSVKVSLNEYNYKGKKGVTTYIVAMMIVKNGEYKPLSAADFADDLPF